MTTQRFPLILKTVCVFSIFQLFSCNDSPQNSSKKKELEETTTSNKNNVTRLEAFPVELIKQKSISRKIVYDLSKFDFSKLKKIDSTLFKSCFEGITIDSEKTLKYQASNDYFFFDHKDCDSVFFCSIVEYLSDDYEFRVYHLTIDKMQKKIVHGDWIASQGGEGGYGTSDILEYNLSGNDLVNSSSWTENESKGLIKTKFVFLKNNTIRKTISDKNIK